MQCWKPGDCVIEENEALLDLSEIGCIRISSGELGYRMKIAAADSDVIIFNLMYGLPDGH